MLPRILVLETYAGDAALAAYHFLKTINGNIYISTLVDQETTIPFCKAHNWVYVKNAGIVPIQNKYTIPRLGMYTSFKEQENCYLAYYQDQKLAVCNIVSYIIQRVNPTHIITNIGLLNMYNIFVKNCVSNLFKNVIYYVDKPYSLKTDYLAVNEITLKPRIHKGILSPKEINAKLKMYEKFYGTKILEKYPNIMTFPEELLGE